MQHRFLRIVFRNNENMRIAEMHNILGVGKLNFKKKTKFMWSNVQAFKNTRDLVTRPFDKIVLKIPNVILTKSFNSLMYRGSQLPTLPQNIQNCELYKDFKYQLKPHILECL